MERRGAKFWRLMPTTKIDNKDVHVDPTILFSRLTALAIFNENVLDNFSYVLTIEPASLLKHGLILKPSKATLRNHFTTKEKAITPIEFDVCVVYGGALIHKVKWPKTTWTEDIQSLLMWWALWDILMSFLRKCRNTLAVPVHHQLIYKFNY